MAQWPTHKQDLNPLDYGIVGMMEGKVNTHSCPHCSLDHLKATIQRECQKVIIRTSVRGASVPRYVSITMVTTSPNVTQNPGTFQQSDFTTASPI